MKIAIPTEIRAGETRVAATPESVKKFIGLGASVIVQSGAGAGARIPDSAYQAAGASIAPDFASAVSGADVVLKVQRPTSEEVSSLKGGVKLFAILAPYTDPETLQALASQGVDSFAMEFMPRITRAQSMDVLSSQSNLAGYKAVIDAASAYGKALPMMMTAAGTVAAARIFIMGVGVAGLQAIATARRLGAIVTATDVRPATEEQVKSLGAEFIAVKDEEFAQAQTAGGYAKQMSAEYQRKQAELVATHIARQDIVVTTALIPGRKAPVLVTEAMLASMKPGSVLIDLAAEQGGNVAGAQLGRTVETPNGVRIIGPENIAGQLAADASSLYARNLFNFVSTMVDKEKKFEVNWEDELVKGTNLTRGGAIVHPNFAAPKAAG